ncbi:hypothetical protein GCM10009642_07840 [Nocardiopsis metallicus]
MSREREARLGLGAAPPRNRTFRRMSPVPASLRHVQNSLTLPDLLNDAAILSLEHQLHLETVVGDLNWHVDLAEPKFDFHGESELVCERFHLLGSAAPGPGSWLWAWANPSGFLPETIELAESVRDLGREYGVPELAEPEVPFAALPGSPEEPHQVLSLLTDAAKVLTGRFTAYNGPVGGGTRAAFLLEHPSFLLAEATPMHAVSLIQQAVSGVPYITDHRRAVYSYGRLRGLDPEFSADGRTLALKALGIGLEFDELNRLTRIEGSLTPDSI